MGAEEPYFIMECESHAFAFLFFWKEYEASQTEEMIFKFLK